MPSYGSVSGVHAEVASVEVDAQPLRIDGLDQVDHLPRRSRDPAMVLQGQHDALLGRRLRAFGQSLDRPAEGVTSSLDLSMSVS